MITEADIEFMKLNRSELTANRTVPVTLVLASGAVDPYTNEPVEGYESTTGADAIWKEVGTIDIVNGVQLQSGDVKVSFDATVDLSAVIRIEYAGIRYNIVSIADKGIGSTNRRECVARRST